MQEEQQYKANNIPRQDDIDFDDVDDGQTQFKEQCLSQYYRYINLMKRTDNFAKSQKLYQQLNDHDYQNLAIIGWVFQVNNAKIVDINNKQQIYMTPVVHTNISYPFVNYQELSQCSNNNTQVSGSHSQPVSPKKLSQVGRSSTVAGTEGSSNRILRKLLFTKSFYVKHYVKIFNLILKQSKLAESIIKSSHKQQFSSIQRIYCFTSLKVTIQNEQIYFVPTSKTKIIGLDLKFYQDCIEHLQKSIAFQYSYIKIPIQGNLNSQTLEQGFSLQRMQNQASIIDKVSFTGILKQFDIEQNIGNRKDKQVILTFYEDDIRPKRDQIGVAKVVIKLELEQNIQQVKSYFKFGYVYLICNAAISVSDIVNIGYKLKQKWRSSIFNLQTLKSTSIGHLIPQIPISNLAIFKLPAVYRNILKIRVNLIKCEFIFGKYICCRCKHPKRSIGDCHVCDGNEEELKLWSMALVCDQSCYGQISLETNQTIQFFNLTAVHLEQIKKKCLFQQSQRSITEQRKMVKLFNHYDYFLRRQSPNSEPASLYQKYIVSTFIEKCLLGIPRYNLNEHFNQLTVQQKIQFQQSLYTSKQFIKKNKHKTHFNGYLATIDKKKKLVPFLKIIQVVDQ